MNEDKKQKTIVIGAGPVGALAALYAAQRGHEVEIYELRSGMHAFHDTLLLRKSGFGNQHILSDTEPE